MFENLFSNLKNQANNITDNIKSKSRRFSLNINSLKNRITNKNKPTTYYTICIKEHDDFYDNDYLSPRACVNENWPSMSENMQWVPIVPPKLDEHNIVDRFIKVITLDDDDVRPLV